MGTNVKDFLWPDLGPFEHKNNQVMNPKTLKMGLRESIPVTNIYKQIRGEKGRALLMVKF